MGVRRDHHRYSKRITRTKRWKALRAQILERDGFRCRSCGCGGRLEVDHVQPVRTHPELSYDPANLQALCPSCHTRKTRIECGHKQRSDDAKAWDSAVRQLEGKTQPNFSIPFGLTRSAIPVTIVAGPPASGKTTFARAAAGPDDVIIDFDDFLRAVGGRPWDTDRAKVQEAFRLRNAAIRSLSTRRTGRAWLILTAPSGAERRAWANALSRTTFEILAVDADTCKDRVSKDTTRAHAAQRMFDTIDKWWATYAAERGPTASSKRKSDA